LPWEESTVQMDFVKLYSSITRSTIWDESSETRVLWVTMLAISNRDGYVAASLPGLARDARLTIEQTEVCLAKLMAPDTHSRTPDQEGRRIEKVDGGWRIINFKKYLEMRTVDDRRAADRERQARHRLSRLSRDSHESSLGEESRVDCASRGAPSGAPSLYSQSNSSSLLLGLDANVCKTTTARDPSTTKPVVRAKRERKPAVGPDPKLEPVRAIFAAYEQAMVRVHGPKWAIGVAMSPSNVSIAREVLESAKGSKEDACALVSLLPELELPWLVEKKWSFHWAARCLPELVAERARREADPEEEAERLRQREIADLRRRGFDAD